MLVTNVRQEQAMDRDAIFAVTRAAFGREAEAKMVDAIRTSDRYVPELSLIAEENGAVVGHVILSYIDLDERRVLALGPISVVPERQRDGIGSMLVRESLRLADERGEPLVLLLGHPWYYPRFGFRCARELGIEPPDESIPDEAWMGIPLRAYDPKVRGRATFPPAFASD